jgi:hypothetical protein
VEHPKKKMCHLNNLTPSLCGQSNFGGKGYLN